MVLYIYRNMDSASSDIEWLDRCFVCEVLFWSRKLFAKKHMKQLTSGTNTQEQYRAIYMVQTLLELVLVSLVLKSYLLNREK